MSSLAIRSFVRRSGRITGSQQRALTTLWSTYCIDVKELIDLETLFSRPAEKHLEIGFGMGEALWQMAQAQPQHDYLGIEVHQPGIGKLLNALERYQINNVRIICADALEVLQHYVPTASLDAVYIFFPDPWPKLRHHKRRLIQPPVVELLAHRVKTHGLLHLATDWQPYAEHMLTVLNASPYWLNQASESGFLAARPPQRPLTQFEQRGHRLGHHIWDLCYRRC